MRRLFFRIFAVFWLTESLIFIISTALIVAKKFPSTTTISEALDTHLQHDADVAFHAYRQRGCAGFLDNHDRNEPAGAELTDWNLQPVCGGIKLEVPSDLLAHFQDRPFGVEVNGRFVWLVPLRAADGTALRYAWNQPSQPKSVHAYDNFRHFAFPWLPVAIGVGGLTTFLLVLTLIRPIMRLREAARKLADGDLSARVPQSDAAALRPHSDAFDGLVVDFNYMASRLQSLVGAQQLLLRDVSHELRSPLSRLSVALELTREQNDSDRELHLGRIEREAERLNQLIGQLLTLSSLDSRMAPSIREAMSLNKLCRMIVQDANYEAQHQYCRVEMLESPECHVRGDPALIHRALENLVRNAIRYTEPGTAVELRVCCTAEKMARVEISDRGPGIPDRELSNILRPFYRLDNARSPGTGGYGVGLAIAQRAIKLHGGELKLHNRREGGLMAVITLPLISISEALEVRFPLSTKDGPVD